MATILVIEDDPVVLDSTIAILDGMGHRSLGTTTLASGLVSAKANHPEAVLMDVHLPDGDGSCAIKELRAIDPLMGVILFTGDLELHTATKAMESGAFEFLTKPFSYQSLQLAVNEVLRSRTAVRMKREPGNCDANVPTPREGAVASRRLLGATSEICRANLLIERFAKTPNTPILIMGESGTGKELCAAAIHMLSERSSGPFVKINCPAIPRSLIESELFGFEKGSFTDAKTSRPGVFEQADGGTLFLDEVGELDLDLQPKLLRVLEEKVVYRIGSRLPRPVNVRVVSATNRNIPEYCREGRFREDLYFRLAVLQITLPPLRERVPDIPLLAEHLLRDRSQAVGRYFTSLSTEVMDFLVEYRWPGNVRELKNFIERLVILSPQQGVLHMSRDELSRHTFLPTSRAACEDSIEHDRTTERNNTHAASGRTGIATPVTAASVSATQLLTLDEAEKHHILSVLDACSGNRTSAATVLGIARSTLCRKLARYSIPMEAGDDDTADSE